MQDTAAHEPDELPRLLKVNEVAKVLRVSHDTVYRLMRSGELHSVQVGGSRRIPPRALDKWLVSEGQGQP